MISLNNSSYYTNSGSKLSKKTDINFGNRQHVVSTFANVVLDAKKLGIPTKNAAKALGMKNGKLPETKTEIINTVNQGRRIAGHHLTRETHHLEGKINSTLSKIQGLLRVQPKIK